MSGDRSTAALALALSALVADNLDVADVLAHLMTGATTALGADAVALMVRDGRDLSLLAASSHRATELEMLQIQAQAGPCVDVIATGATVELDGAARIVDRWGDVGQAIVDAGFTSVAAYPMRWRGESLGGLNIFRNRSEDDGDTGRSGDDHLCQAFADVCMLVVVQSAADAVSHEQLHALLHEALTARELVEQAKGVLSYTDDLDMEAAYRELLRRSAVTQVPLTQLATHVVRGRGRAT